MPFPAAAPAESAPALTPVERNAFSELANRLTARLRGRDKDKPEQAADTAAARRRSRRRARAPPPKPPRRGAEPSEPAIAPRTPGADQRPILDRLPVGVLVYRLDKLIYANRAFLDWTGYEQSARAGSRPADSTRCSSSRATASSAPTTARKSLTIATNQGDQVPVEARLFTSPWEGESALVLMLTGVGGSGADDRQKTFETALRHAKAEARELRDILDAAADGVVVLDREAQVHSINRGARNAVRL